MLLYDEVYMYKREHFQNFLNTSKLLKIPGSIDPRRQTSVRVQKAIFRTGPTVELNLIVVFVRSAPEERKETEIAICVLSQRKPPGITG